MTVIDVIQDWDFELVRSKENLTTRAVFTVALDGTDSADSEPFIVNAYGSIPSIGQAHPGNEWVFVIDKRVRRTAPHFFEVIANYSSLELSGNENNPISPLVQGSLKNYFPVNSSEHIDRQVINTEGKTIAITNSSGESFDPPATKDVADLGMRIIKAQAVFDKTDALEFYNTINSAEFEGFAKGLVKCVGISAEKVNNGGVEYWSVTYEFHVRKDGWKLRRLDEGYSVKKAASGSTHNVLNSEAGVPGTYRIFALKGTEEGGVPEIEPISEPARLDGQGNLLASTAEDVFLEFNVYDEKSFSGIS